MKISSLAKSSLGQHLNRRTKGVLTLLVFAACYATLSTSPGDYSVRDKAHQDRRFLREQQEEGPDEGVFEPGYEELVGNQVLESSKEEEDLHEGFEEWAEYEEAETVGDSNESKRAIALISFGKEAAESTLLERCVLSIRRRGAFDGPVVVLTDAPRERYDGVLDDNVTVLNVKREDMKFDMFRNREYTWS